jgi:hypothetical protein
VSNKGSSWWQLPHQPRHQLRSNISDDALRSITALRGLKSLHLRDCRSVTNDGSRAMSSLPHLTNLDLRPFELTGSLVPPTTTDPSTSITTHWVALSSIALGGEHPSRVETGRTSGPSPLTPRGD